MGRGRQKAKDAKIARQLKYSAPDTDLRALERELVTKTDDGSEPDEDDVYDRWSDEK